MLKQIRNGLILWFTVVPTEIWSAAICGYVVDGTSGEPLPVASVVLEGTERGTATNLDGYFVVDFVAPGTYRLQVSRLGYQTRVVETAATEGRPVPVRIEIHPAAVQLKEAVVALPKEGTTLTRQSPQVSAVPLDAKIIRLMPSLGAEMDVLRALQNLPGVKASSDLSSALYVRGGSPDMTLILMDRNTVYNPNHLFGLFSTFNADAVKHINLMKGGFPAEYGMRSGSVLEVVTNEGNRKRHQGLASLGLVSARAALEGPLSACPGSYAISGRRTYFDPLISYLNQTQNLDLPRYYFYDTNGKVNLDLTDRTTLTLAGYWGEDLMDLNAGPSDSRFRFQLHWGNRTWSSRLRQAAGRNRFVSTGVTFSTYHSEWRFDNEGVVLDHGRSRLIDYSFQSDLEFLGAKEHQVKTGLWVTHLDIAILEENQDMVWVDVKEGGFNYAAYVQDRWRLSPHLEVQPGVRGYVHDNGSGTGAHRTLDPRLAAVYHWDNRLRFKGAVGLYTQFLNLLTFGEGFSNFDMWVPVDESLDPGRTVQSILGCEFDPTPRDQLTVEVYYNDLKNVVEVQPLLDSGENARDPFVVGKGYAYGAEFMARRTEGRFIGWVGYSLSWSRRCFPGTLVNRGKWFYPKWDRRHDFIAVGDFRLSERWELTGSWRFNTGQGFTQGLGVYTFRVPGVDPEYLADRGRSVLYGAYNNYRFPPDHRLDLSVIYHHRLAGKPAKLVFSIFNVYNRRPYWQRWFDTSTNPVVVVDAKLLPILPLASYEVRW